jgi:hypothetical protein
VTTALAVLSRLVPERILDDACQAGLDERPREKLAMVCAELDTLTTQARAPIPDEAEFSRLNDTLGNWKRAAKELELTRKALVEPHNGAVRAINEFFRFLLVPGADFEARAKKLMVLYRQEEESRRRREAEAARVRQEQAAVKEAEAEAQGDLAAAQEASREQTAAALAVPRAMPTTVKTQAATTTTRKRWTFEVVAPDLVPPSYCTPDEKKIRAAVADGVREIPGVNVFETEELSVRTA